MCFRLYNIYIYIYIQFMLHTSESYIIYHVGCTCYIIECHGVCFLVVVIHCSATPVYSSILEHTREYSSIMTRAYSSVLEHTRVYARVLGVQSPIASAMKVSTVWVHGPLKVIESETANPEPEESASFEICSRNP